MIKLLDFSPVLTVFPYALLYYVLLLASSGLALVVLLRTDAKNNQLRTSLLVIFLCQLVLLTANLLAYQGLELLESIFPILHRSLNLIALIWLVWALFNAYDLELTIWLPTAATILVLLLSSFNILWWLPGAEGRSFNFTSYDYGWIGVSLLLTLVSGVVLTRRVGRIALEALLILATAALGFILYLLMPGAGNMPAVVMLSQLLYYPLLLSFANQERKRQEKLLFNENEFSGNNTSLRENIANTFLEVSLHSSRNSLEKSLSHGLSLYLMADLLGFLSFDEGQTSMKLSNTYDLIREDHLKKVGLPIEQFPVLLSALEEEKLLISNKSSQHRAEKEALIPLSGYNRVGNLILYPLESFKAGSKRAILALSPYTAKEWGDEELSRLDSLKNNISKLLQKAIKLEEDAVHLNDLQEELIEKTQQIQVLNRQYTQSTTELAEANDKLSMTQSAWKEEVNLWIDRQKQLEKELEELRDTIEANRENMEQVDQLRTQKQQLEATIQQNSQKADQLKLALEQASQLLGKLSFTSEEAMQADGNEELLDNGQETADNEGNLEG